MKPKLLELSEILKKKPEIKERLERLNRGCWIQGKSGYREPILYDYDTLYTTSTFFANVNEEYINKYYKIIGREPQYSDVLEYLGDEDYCLYHGGIGYLGDIIISLSHGPLSDQTDEKIDEIISLCKNVGVEKM